MADFWCVRLEHESSVFSIATVLFKSPSTRLIFTFGRGILFFEGGIPCTAYTQLSSRSTDQNRPVPDQNRKNSEDLEPDHGRKNFGNLGPGPAKHFKLRSSLEESERVMDNVNKTVYSDSFYKAFIGPGFSELMARFWWKGYYFLE